MEKKKNYIKPLSELIRMDECMIMAGSLGKCNDDRYGGLQINDPMETSKAIWGRDEIIEGNPDDIDAKKDKWHNGLWDN